MPRDMTAAHAGRRRAAEARERRVRTEVHKILSDPRINEERTRKLRYVQNEIEQGRTDKFIRDLRDTLIAEARR